MRDTEFLTWPEMKEHLHYIAWLLFTLTGLQAGGHAAILVVCVSVGEYVDGQRLLWTLLAAGVLGPVAYAWRKFGEQHCRFAEFDAILDRCFDRAGASPHLQRLEALIAAIDRARGMERQLARNEARHWLDAHGPDLSAEERELVNARLDYLWKR